MAKKTKRKKADSCWDGYSNYWDGQHHYKEGKNGDRVRDCKSDEEIAAMSSKEDSALTNKPKKASKAKAKADAAEMKQKAMSGKRPS